MASLLPVATEGPLLTIKYKKISFKFLLTICEHFCTEVCIVHFFFKRLIMAFCGERSRLEGNITGNFEDLFMIRKVICVCSSFQYHCVFGRKVTQDIHKPICSFETNLISIIRDC